MLAAFMARVIDPNDLAETQRREVRTMLAAHPGPLRIRGILTAGEGPSAVYAEYTRKACESVGVAFETVVTERLAVEDAIKRANDDETVHGIMVYYPVFGTQQDAYLRDTVSPNKDMEGLHELWRRRLFDNVRFVDEAQTKKCILPCTPLAILKLVDGAGFFADTGQPLHGKKVCIFNRSEVVGRPLAVMLANDGADVVSFDIDGPLHFVGTGEHAHRVEEIDIDRATALKRADIVITGVPSKAFEKVRADEVRPGALCLNFSTRKNFAPDVKEAEVTFIPRVGPMTVTMAIRNAARLYGHTHT